MPYQSLYDALDDIRERKHICNMCTKKRSCEKSQVFINKSKVQHCSDFERNPCKMPRYWAE